MASTQAHEVHEDASERAFVGQWRNSCRCHIKVGNLWKADSFSNSVCEQRVGCEPAVGDEQAEAMAQD